MTSLHGQRLYAVHTVRTVVRTLSNQLLSLLSAACTSNLHAIHCTYTKRDESVSTVLLITPPPHSVGTTLDVIPEDIMVTPPTITIQESSPALDRKGESPPPTVSVEGETPTVATEVPTSSQPTEEAPVEDNTTSVNNAPPDSVSVGGRVCACAH